MVHTSCDIFELASCFPPSPEPFPPLSSNFEHSTTPTLSPPLARSGPFATDQLGGRRYNKIIYEHVPPYAMQPKAGAAANRK